MKKKLFMGMALLAIIGAGAVFAQAATLDKLSFTPLNPNTDIARYEVKAVNNSISGVVVIPGHYQDKTVGYYNVREIASNGFRNVTGITSVYIPLTMGSIGQNAFRGCTGLTNVIIDLVGFLEINENAFTGCTNLNSVTFYADENIIKNANTFPGDLRAKYQGGGAGTYTRPRGSNTWTRQGDPKNDSADKLRFEFVEFIGAGAQENIYAVYPANKSISGDVVIPTTWQGRPVGIIFNNAFENCTGITGITIPWNISIRRHAFKGCTNLTSVTFQIGGISLEYPNDTFDGNLGSKFIAKDGGTGTYTRTSGSNSWTKQGEPQDDSKESKEDDTTQSTTESVRTIFSKIFDIFDKKK